MKLRASVATFVAAATCSTAALAQQAQPYIQDRAYGEGIGIRVGNLELHPGIALEAGYDSNYFLRSEEEGRIDAFRLRETVSLSLSTLGAQRRSLGAAPPTLTLRSMAFVGFNQIFPINDNRSGVYATNEVEAQNRVDAGATLALDVLPASQVGADLLADFVRASQPSNNPDLGYSWDRDSLRLGAGVIWRPGGGLFDWRLGYEFQYNFFEREAFQSLNNVHHYVNTRGRFRFLPRTALVYDASYGWIRYTSEATGQNDAEVVRSRVGVNGLVTSRLAALALVGWTASFYERTGARDARNFDSVTAQAELRYFLLPQPKLQPGDATVGLSAIAVGYLRDFTNSYLGDFYGRDRGYIGFSYFVGGRALIDLQGGYSRISHPTMFWPDTVATQETVRAEAFTDHRIDAQLFGEYRLTDIIALNTTVRYDTSLTGQAIRAVPGDYNPNDPNDPNDPSDPNPQPVAPPPPDHLGFERWQAFVGGRVFW